MDKAVAVHNREATGGIFGELHIRNPRNWAHTTFATGEQNGPEAAPFSSFAAIISEIFKADFQQRSQPTEYQVSIQLLKSSMAKSTGAD